MKMIYVGSLANKPDRDSGWIREFSKLGWDVIPFSSDCDSIAIGVIDKVKRRLHIGKKNRDMQIALLSLISTVSPDWVHFRLPIDFDRRTILSIKKNVPVVTQYFNDDPFSCISPIGLNWKFKRALTAYDAHFVYRSHNIPRYLKAGATVVEHCPPTYDPNRHFLGKRNENHNFIADAAFIGHWENDNRVQYLEALYKYGIKIIIKGGMWDRALSSCTLQEILPIDHAFGDEYNYIYSNVAAGLCFFSKINNDFWTERALEIIAVGGLLVCERTKEAESYFVDGEEAYFFSSVEELIEIINELKNNSKKREQVCEAGYKRLLSGNHSIHDRAKMVAQFAQSKI